MYPEQYVFFITVLQYIVEYHENIKNHENYIQNMC